MANPQCENGFTKIANDLMDALCRCHPGGSEGQILLAILRKTYGWNKKADHISISQLCDMTSVCRRTAIYAIHNLEAKNMIVIHRQKVDGLNECNMIELQKDYEKWVVQEMDGSARKSKSYKATIEKQKKKYHESKYKIVVQEMDGSARNSKVVVQENENDRRFLAPTKDTITKDNIKDSLSSPSPKADPCPHQAIVEIYHEILPELPAVKIWTEKRKALLRSRWKEDATRQSLDWWRTFFTDQVKTSDFLTGKKSDWKADLEWILKPTNFVKVIEGRYQNNGNKPEDKPPKLSPLMQAY